MRAPASAAIPNLAALRLAATEATSLLRALANEDRLLLLCQLSQGELSVGELQTQVGIAQPTLSQQLAVLRHQGLVQTRREGRQIRYSVSDARVLALLRGLYEQFCPI